MLGLEMIRITRVIQRGFFSANCVRANKMVRRYKMAFPMVTVLVIMATANQTTVAMVPPCQTDQSPKLSTTQYFYPYSIQKDPVLNFHNTVLQSLLM